MEKKQPKPPADLGPCVTCRHFCREIKMEFVSVQGQEFPAEIARQQNGGILPAMMKAVSKSPCTFLAVWHMVTPEWWCGQWAAVSPLDDSGLPRQFPVAGAN